MNGWLRTGLSNHERTYTAAPSGGEGIMGQPTQLFIQLFLALHSFPVTLMPSFSDHGSGR